MVLPDFRAFYLPGFAFLHIFSFCFSETEISSGKASVFIVQRQVRKDCCFAGIVQTLLKQGGQHRSHAGSRFSGTGLQI